ncbi:MAG TPA: hypothetical protein VGF55_03490 [Gemmataceae bacterium]|jgi:hypothetical protein
MHLSDETLAVLWLAAGAVVLWRLLPAVLNALGLTLWQGSIDHDPAALEPSGDDAGYDDLFAQLRRNGFEPVGRRNTTCRFFLHHWRKTFRSRVFAARQGDGIALAYKLRTWDPWRLCFVTAFSDGAILETANQMESFRIDEPGHRRWGLATPDRGLLLERHRQACREFAAAGSRSVAALPAEEVNRLIRYHESRHHRKTHRWTGLKVVSTSLWPLVIALLLIRRLAGTAPYLLPVSVIAWGFLWPAIQASLFRAAAGSFRAEDAGRQRNRPAPGRPGGEGMERSESLGS